MVLTWLIAIPIGIYSAVRQYTIFDYVFTFIGFIGMATPPFLLALVVMYFAYTTLGISVGGLFSDRYAGAPWSFGKLLDFLSHVWIPVLVLAVSSTAGLIRTVRANLLDQLDMPYVETARSKGVAPLKLLLKYPVRIAINPVVSTIGWMLPALVSGSVIVSMVLSLPTTGPLMLTALFSQDMYLAGSFVMMLSVLTVIGTLISDILLAWVDPRIRFERKNA
jgi:peptide/nickel transport system permease protein